MLELGLERCLAPKLMLDQWPPVRVGEAVWTLRGH